MDRYADRTTEMSYQESFKDLVLERLGWKLNQIEEQRSLQIGSSERLIPDIIVSSDDCTHFVVEVKKADHVRTQKNIDQLVSYMKQLETPVGIYVGKQLEVYFKSIGNGTEPMLLMSLSFDSAERQGEDFVRLFSAQDFSIENIVSYIAERNAAEKFQKNVDIITETLTSKEFYDEFLEFVNGYFRAEDYTQAEIDKALSQIDMEVKKRMEYKSFLSVSDSQILSIHTESRPRVTPTGVKRNNGKARRYAYNLIKQIIEKNKSLNFRQLYGIFGHKNYIEDINKIKDVGRWCMDEEDILTSIDGIRIVVSNQWGFRNTAKPRMDKLIAIAKSYGIDTTLS